MAFVPVQNLSIQDQANVHLGDNNYYVNQSQEQNDVQSLGLCWGFAPLIDADSFIGRVGELNQMAQILRPGQPTVEQRRLVLGGMGGIGKTQLAIAYARQYQDSYTSVFWLNATTEQTLRANYVSLARTIVKTDLLRSTQDEHLLDQVQNWLCDTKNFRWLLLLDNHDDPDQFDINRYCPNVGHGSIVITSRLPERVSGCKIRLSPMQDIDECLDILRTRSRRKIERADSAAHSLVHRLSGLPLALATAGAYLSRGSVTISQYLRAYEQRWKVDPRRPPRLRDYQNRTLYTTWDLTYSQLSIDDPHAAGLLRLLAYFNNQEVWYELLRAGVTQDSPLWQRQLVADIFSFESAMATLMEYCLVEKKDGSKSYHVHNCIHDWIFNGLNQNLDWQLYRYAFRSISTSIDNEDWEASNMGHLQYNQLASHARRLTHDRFQSSDLSNVIDHEGADQAVRIATLLSNQRLWTSAAWMYKQVLVYCEKAFGFDHTSTLQTLVNLACVYQDQGKLDEAFSLYKKAISGFQRSPGSIQPATLTAIDNLGTLYAQKGQIGLAQRLFERVRAGREIVFGPLHILTITSMNNVGLSYLDQGNFEEAEWMLERALKRQEGLGHNYTATTLSTLHNLGKLYSKQSRNSEAKSMYLHVIAGYETLMGPHHESTLEAIKNLGILYVTEAKYDEAEQMYLRALIGKEKSYGTDSISTINTLCRLGSLYIRQNKPDDAERMYLRALARIERSDEPDQAAIFDISHNLGLIYIAVNKLDQADQAISRALNASQQSMMLEDDSTLILAHRLSCRYIDQGNLGDAERTLTKILTFHGTNDFKSLYRLTIVDLANTLALSVLRAGSKQIVERQLGRCVRHVDRWRREIKIGLMVYLSKPLASINDDINSTLAILHHIRATDLTPLDFSCVTCDGCDCSIVLKLGRHVCRQCEDVDICDACMTAYREKRIAVPNCNEHEFFNAASAISKLLESPEDEDAKDVDTWMSKLKAQYPVSGGEDDYLIQTSTPKFVPP